MGRRPLPCQIDQAALLESLILVALVSFKTYRASSDSEFQYRPYHLDMETLLHFLVSFTRVTVLATSCYQFVLLTVIDPCPSYYFI